MQRDTGARVQVSATSPTIRLFTPGGEGADFSPETTLAEFYRRYYLPIVLVARGAKQRNIEQYEQSIKLWTQLTGDPPLAQIDEFTLAEFLAKLRAAPGKRLGSTMASNTIHKHCRTLQAVLDRAGPKSRENRYGKGLIEDVPFLQKPSVEKRLQFDRHLPLADIARWLEATRGADQPRLGHVAASVWWQSLILFDYNTGPRIGELLALRWGWLVTDEYGTWFRLPAEASKTNCERLIYCNAAAQVALAKIRPSNAQPGDHVFAWAAGLTWLHKLRRAQFEAAGLLNRYGHGFHALRRSCATQAGLIGGALLAKIVLGHANRDVASMSYLQLAELCRPLEQLPQPPWKWPASEKQLSLF